MHVAAHDLGVGVVRAMCSGDLAKKRCKNCGKSFGDKWGILLGFTSRVSTLGKPTSPWSAPTKLSYLFPQVIQACTQEAGGGMGVYKPLPSSGEGCKYDL